jgi:hypothetical protein
LWETCHKKVDDIVLSTPIREWIESAREKYFEEVEESPYKKELTVSALKL